MSILRLILADQLNESLASLNGVDKKRDVILFCEVITEATYVPHHPKKIAFLFSAMRHFSETLQEQGFRVRYITLDNPSNTGSFDGEIARAVNELKPQKIILTAPGEWRVLQMMTQWEGLLGIPVEILEDSRFLCNQSEFSRWAGAKKQFRMEFFYREMRKKYHILIDADGNPVGGEWNYDKENRKPPKSGMRIPKRFTHIKSEMTKEVLNLVEQRFGHHFGTLLPFNYAVTRPQALMELEHFIDKILPYFGDYQDAMILGEPYLYHSLISSYLNAGLLLPLEICQKAEKAYFENKAPLNAVEGFIRQILGWREYVRGIYWHQMPSYADLNYFNATLPLPDFYWGEKTQMVCISEAVRHTKDHAYSHHIQRLMITGNFALLAGLDVRQVQAWYLAVYSDAYEWVEMPNTLGMALFGDGGIMGSKPYAASGKYIQRMSNYCQTCRYNPNEMTGDTACPFNALYWDFLVRNDSKLRGNQRMAYMFATWDKFNLEKQQKIREHAKTVLLRMQDKQL